MFFDLPCLRHILNKEDTTMAEIKYQSREPFKCFSLTDFHMSMNDVKMRPSEKIAQDLYTNDDSMGYLMAHEMMAAGSNPATHSPALAPGLKYLKSEGVFRIQKMVFTSASCSNF